MKLGIKFFDRVKLDLMWDYVYFINIMFIIELI